MSYAISLAGLMKAPAQSPHIQDRRFDSRVDVSEFINVLISPTDRSLGLVLDVSGEGMCVRGHDPFVKGKEYSLRLVVCPYGGEEVQFIDLTAICVWTSELRYGGYKGGFQFVHRTAKARMRLDSLVKRLALDNLS